MAYGTDLDEREQYRLDATQIKDLQVSVRVSEGSSSQGRLVDLSVSGASLSIPLTGGPAFAVGEEAELSFTSTKLEKPLTVSARLVHRTGDGECHCYGLRFTDPQQFEGRLPPVLYRLFNRRRSYRVKPAPDSPVEVVLQAGTDDMQFKARLVDISATGVGLRVPPETESALAQSDRVEVSIALPGPRDALRFNGVIRSRRLVGEGIQYGIEFDLEGSKESQRQQDAVIDFVMERQRAELRKAKGG